VRSEPDARLSGCLEPDRLRAARYRARKKARDQLPAQITDAKANGEALVKAAKGLGR
jgi:hypothetical protein